MGLATAADISFYRKDGYSATYTYKVDGVAQNITGYTADFIVKDKLNDEDSEARIDKSMTIQDAPNGVFQLELTTTDTDQENGVYDYGVTVVPSGGEPISFQGKLEIGIRAREDNP